jgi:hypothetical protein
VTLPYTTITTNDSTPGLVEFIKAARPAFDAYAVVHVCCGHEEVAALFTTAAMAEAHAVELSEEDDRPYHVVRPTIHTTLPGMANRYHYRMQNGPFADSVPRLWSVTWSTMTYDPRLPDLIEPSHLVTWDAGLTAEQVAARLAL